MSTEKIAGRRTDTVETKVDDNNNKDEAHEGVPAAEDKFGK